MKNKLGVIGFYTMSVGMLGGLAGMMLTLISSMIPTKTVVAETADDIEKEEE